METLEIIGIIYGGAITIALFFFHAKATAEKERADSAEKQQRNERRRALRWIGYNAETTAQGIRESIRANQYAELIKEAHARIEELAQAADAERASANRWEEEARRYCGNADYWNDRTRKAEAEAKRYKARTRRQSECIQTLHETLEKYKFEAEHDGDYIRALEALKDKWKEAANGFRDAFYLRPGHSTTEASKAYSAADVADRSLRTGERTGQGGKSQS
jgi:hypothetical protein